MDVKAYIFTSLVFKGSDDLEGDATTDVLWCEAGYKSPQRKVSPPFFLLLRFLTVLLETGAYRVHGV
jgi:hypothetical protein